MHEENILPTEIDLTPKIKDKYVCIRDWLHFSFRVFISVINCYYDNYRSNIFVDIGSRILQQ